MAYPVFPFIRTPLTDLTDGLVSHQRADGNCSQLDRKIISCMEAYGVRKGEIICADIISDFKECFRKAKQHQRWVEMRNERHRQIKAGERKKEDAYAEPPILGTYQTK